MTTLMAEYPRPHLPRETIAYYPLPRDENQLLYAKYAAAAQAEFPLICLAGRLATYQYYNTDQACACERTISEVTPKLWAKRVRDGRRPS